MANLEELAADIRDGYIDMIESHGHTYKGKLAESMRTIRVEVEAGGQKIKESGRGTCRRGSSEG